MLDDRPERPLDDDERRVLSEISAAYERDDPGLARRLDGVEGIVHPPVRRTGTPLRWRVVGIVMAVAVLCGLGVAMLPPAVAPLVVIGMMLVGIPGACVVWAARRGEL